MESLDERQLGNRDENIWINLALENDYFSSNDPKLDAIQLKKCSTMKIVMPHTLLTESDAVRAAYSDLLEAAGPKGMGLHPQRQKPEVGPHPPYQLHQ